MKLRVYYLILTAFLALELKTGVQSEYKDLQNLKVKALKNSNRIKEDSEFKENEINETISSQKPYLLPEPLKTIAQTTTRFALAQTPLPDHMTIDGTMDILNDAFYLLAKPEIMMKMFKLSGVVIASSMGAALIAPELVDTIWRKPSSLLSLDQYFNETVIESRVMSIANTTTDHVFESVGLNARVCRERSICYLGEIFHCWAPKTSDALIRFAERNFSSSSNALKTHPLVKAFLLGFVDHNCSAIEWKPSSSITSNISERSIIEHNNSCFRSFINNLVRSNRDHKKN